LKEKKRVVEISKLHKSPKYKELLTNDKKCLFYTNITNIEIFHKLHEIIHGVRNRFHKKVPVVKRNKKTPLKRGRHRCLDSKDELLLTLIKLRLGLLFQD